MTARINHWLLGVFALATAGAMFIGEDAREPHGPLPIDRHVLRFAIDHRTAMWDDIALIVSHLGDPVTLALMALAATVLLWGRRRSVIEVAVPITALIVAGAIEFITKRTIGRPRPPAMYHLLHETDPSFPSGHATGSAAFFVALALVVSPRLRSTLARIVLVVASGTLAALIGASRVVLGVHWLTDIAAGWLLGVAVAAGAVLVGRQWLPPLESGRVQRAKPTGDEPPPGVGSQQVWDDVPVRVTHPRHGLGTAVAAILVIGAVLVGCGAQSDSAAPPTTKSSSTAMKTPTTVPAPTATQGPCGSSPSSRWLPRRSTRCTG